MTDKNLKFSAQLEQIVQRVKYGQISMVLQIHEGRIVSVLGTNFEHRKYKGDGAESAVAELLTKLKESRIEGKTGSLVGTFRFHKGQVKEMIVQTNFKKYL